MFSSNPFPRVFPAVHVAGILVSCLTLPFIYTDYTPLDDSTPTDSALFSPFLSPRLLEVYALLVDNSASVQHSGLPHHSSEAHILDTSLLIPFVLSLILCFVILFSLLPLLS